MSLFLLTILFCFLLFLVFLVYIGAFGNPPKNVGSIFKEELSSVEFVGCFENVIFAIIDPVGTGNLKPFREIFYGGGPL